MLILYQDDVLAVVDKPTGLMVHDSKLARGEDDVLAHRMRKQLGRWIFLVHRLDRATSGGASRLAGQGALYR
ncbi:pseudouridylate synthase [Xanthomonas fragariae LMG 25863]|nr:pseudouridylate synthase [Xanthomonas fragariae LMG 25863]